MDEVDLGVPAKDKMPDIQINRDATVYPHFHYCGPIDLELPDTGEMLVRFIKREETSSIKDTGQHWYECKVEIVKILNVDGEAPEAHVPPKVELPARSMNDAGDALDKIRDQMRGDNDHDEEDRY